MTEIPAADILKSLPQSIGDVIKPWADRSPDRLALVETSGSWTYRQLNDAVDARHRLAPGLGRPPRRSSHARVRQLPAHSLRFS